MQLGETCSNGRKGMLMPAALGAGQARGLPGKQGARNDHAGREEWQEKHRGPAALGSSSEPREAACAQGCCWLQ